MLIRRNRRAFRIACSFSVKELVEDMTKSNTYASGLPAGLYVLKKSIEGWEWLIKKLKSLIKEDLLVSLDQDAAGLLAIDYLANKYGDDSGFDLMDAHPFMIMNLEGMYPGHENSFAAHPHNYYVFTFTIAARIIVLSVRSSGEIGELKAFDQMPYGLIDYNEE